jgi:uncharacterized protein YchJ
MRSRYTAIAAADVRHIMATTHPDSPHRQSDVDARQLTGRHFFAQAPSKQG